MVSSRQAATFEQPAGPSDISRTDRLVVFALLGLWVGATIWRQWGVYAQDLTALYVAGWFWDHGQADLVYDSALPFFGGPAKSWLPLMQTIAPHGDTTFPYVYPPLWAVLLAPLTRAMDLQTFINFSTLLQVPLLAGYVVLAGRLFRPAIISYRLWAFIGVCLLEYSLQSHSALIQNQPQITVGFLVLLAFERLSRGRPVTAGAVLALAAAAKVTPVVFVLIFLVDRQYRALAAFAICGLALGLLSLVLAGVPLHWEFLDILGQMRGSTVRAAVNPSLVPGLMSLGAVLGVTAPLGPAANAAGDVTLIDNVPAALAFLMLVAGGAFIGALAVRLASQASQDRVKLLLFAIAVVIPLFGPVGWQHYFLLPFMMVPGILARLSPLHGSLIAVALGLVSFKYFGYFMRMAPWTTDVLVWASCVVWMVLLAATWQMARPRPGVAA